MHKQLVFRNALELTFLVDEVIERAVLMRHARPGSAAEEEVVQKVCQLDSLLQRLRLELFSLAQLPAVIGFVQLFRVLVIDCEHVDFAETDHEDKVNVPAARLGFFDLEVVNLRDQERGSAVRYHELHCKQPFGAETHDQVVAQNQREVE